MLDPLDFGAGSRYRLPDVSPISPADIVTLLQRLAILPVLAFLAACTGPVPEQAPDEVARLARGIMAMSPDIDAQEAARAADIAVNYPKALRARYKVEDPPLRHNMLVNAGVKPRGLCWHWAQDLQTRLAAENFATLELHRAIANAHTRLLIDHSTVIMSARGDSMEQGMVLDPWRYGGVLYWAPTLADDKYDWVPRQEVFAMKRARRGEVAAEPSSEPLPAAGL